jgi:hypothetical protein
MANKYTQLWVFDVPLQIQCWIWSQLSFWMVRLTKAIGLRPRMSAGYRFILTMKWQPIRDHCVLLTEQFCVGVDSKLLSWRQDGAAFRANAPHFRRHRFLLLRLQGYAPRFSHKNLLVGLFTQVPQIVLYWADGAILVATKTVLP